MNKKLLHKSLLYTLLLLCSFTLPSCEEEDEEAEAWLSGIWYVVDKSYNCPYDYNDTFYFYPDGRLEIEGWRDLERGYWEIKYDRSYRRSILYIYLSDEYAPTISAEMDAEGHSFINLYIHDQDYGGYDLTLRRVRYTYHAPEAQKTVNDSIR